MDEKKQALIERARKTYGKITPCGHKATLDECFTEAQGKLILWFNDTGESTKVEHIDVES